MAKSTAVVNPNLGIHYNRAEISLAPGMLIAGNNFRIKDGKLNNFNLGWESFSDVTLNGAVLKIDNFFINGSEQLIFATESDLYKYNANDDTVDFITPRYETGTAAASGTAVTGVGTAWLTNAKAGDQICFTSAGETDPDATWYDIDSVTNDTALVLTATAGTIAAHAYTIRKRFTGDAGDLWISDVFAYAAPANEDEWWITNGREVPMRWNGVDDQVEEMTSLNLTCKTLAVYSNMMIFGNVTQTGEQKVSDIVNSDIGTPGDIATGLAEQFKVHSGNDEIVSMRRIGDALAIYTNERIVLAQFVDAPDIIFVFRTVVTTHGILAANAIADFGDHHEFIARDSQYSFDGVSLKEVNKHFIRNVLQEQDPVRTVNTYSHFDNENGEILWIVPSTNDAATGTLGLPPSRAVVEHYLEKVPEQFPTPFSIRDFPFTSTGFFSREVGLTWDALASSWADLNFRWNDQFFSASFPIQIAGDVDGKLWSFNTNQNADGEALVSYVRFGKRATVDGNTRALLTRVMPFVSSFADVNLKVTAYMSDHAMGPATIVQTDEFDLNLTEGNYFTTPYRRGRFVQLEFGTDGPSEPYELAGYDLQFRNGGRR